MHLNFSLLLAKLFNHGGPIRLLIKLASKNSKKWNTWEFNLLYKAYFSKLLIKDKNKISIWGVRQLSLVSQATLISTSLLSISLNQVTHTNVPKNFLLEIKQMCKIFL